MERPSPINTVEAGGPLNSDFLDDLAVGVPKAKRHSFKIDVQRGAKDFRAGRAAPKVDAIRKEITSLAKAIAKVLAKPTQKKDEALMWLAACKKLRPRLDKLSPEAVDYLLRHRPPHDRRNPRWGAGELSRRQLEELYALCGGRGSNYRGQYQHAAALIMRCHEAGWSPTKIHDEIKGAIERKWLKPRGLRPGYPSERAIRDIIRREEAEATERQWDIKYGPVRDRGRPRDYAKMILISRLGYAYQNATGKEPFRGAWDRDRGPFVQLVDAVLGQLGEESDDTNLIREYLEDRDTDSRGRKMP